MTNPAQAIRLLVTYAICIPLAIFMGFVMTEVGNQADYTNLFYVGMVIAILASPIFIKWHYPIMVFGLGCPMACFFLKGNPPLWQVVVILSFFIAIIERAINSERRFMRVPLMTWPLLFTLAMTIMTAELTGGIGLKALGGEAVGGKKYLAIFIGIAMYFALTSRPIPKEKRNFYVMLLLLSGLPAFISDLFPYLPSPLNYINLLFPPSASATSGDVSLGLSRLGALATSAGCAANFMLARYGLRGIFSAVHPGRALLFGFLLVMTMLGGFRLTLISYIEMMGLLFILEGLYRTRMLLVFAFIGIIGLTLLVPFADRLPFTFQRALTVVPFLHLDPAARLDADGSKEWREQMWSALWPKVPQYLLLGKGYSISAEDFAMIHSSMEGAEGRFDASQQGLALSMDYHSGPLSTLMPFGIWGAISYIWLNLAGLFILYRNFKYSDPDIQSVNTYLFAFDLIRVFGFLFLFGAYSDDMSTTAKLIGFSIALNWGILKAPALKAAVRPFARRVPARPDHTRPLPA